MTGLPLLGDAAQRMIPPVEGANLAMALPPSLAILVVDLAFGDAGKGTVVDYLIRRHEGGTVVRFNGGPQAAHNVVTGDGRQHTFSQFGSGTFVPGVRTLLGRQVLVEPYAMLNEAAGLAGRGVPDALDRITVDPRCVVITPAHRAANRLRERARGDRAHGTCGIGFGSAVGDSIYRPDLTITVADLADGGLVRRRLIANVRHKLARLAQVLATDDGIDADALRRPDWISHAIDVYAGFARRVKIADVTKAIAEAGGTIVFEGAQGVLLDEQHGFHPHTTWSTTTFANADRLLDAAELPANRRYRIGVLRSYFTRHGAGPFPTEDADLRPRLPEPHNDDRGAQGPFRVGPFDAVLARHALGVAGPVDELALTHMDRLPNLPPHVCTAYDPPVTLGQHAAHQLGSCRPVYMPIPTDDPAAFAHRISDLVGTPVGLLSFGPMAGDKRPLTSAAPVR